MRTGHSTPSLAHPPCPPRPGFHPQASFEMLKLKPVALGGLPLPDWLPEVKKLGWVGSDVVGVKHHVCGMAV